MAKQKKNMFHLFISLFLLLFLFCIKICHSYSFFVATFTWYVSNMFYFYIVPFGNIYIYVPKKKTKNIHKFKGTKFFQKNTKIGEYYHMNLK